MKYSDRILDKFTIEYETNLPKIYSNYYLLVIRPLVYVNFR